MARRAPVRVCAALLCHDIIPVVVETQAVGQTIVRPVATSADLERRVARIEAGL
jgi:hypothetical protein